MHGLEYTKAEFDFGEVKLKMKAEMLPGQMIDSVFPNNVRFFED